MAEIVNLRRARKAHERAEREKRAEESRARFGQSKAEKNLEAARRDKTRRELDGKRIETAEKP